MRRLTSGFTLIELMVVVAIVAILAAIAIPSYSAQVRKTRRAEALSSIQQIQLQMERWRANNPSYSTFAAASADGYDNTYYDFTAPGGAADGDSYSITAKPKSGTDQEKDSCSTLTLSFDAGVTSKSPASGCWN